MEVWTIRLSMGTFQEHHFNTWWVKSWPPGEVSEWTVEEVARRLPCDPVVTCTTIDGREARVVVFNLTEAEFWRAVRRADDEGWGPGNAFDIQRTLDRDAEVNTLLNSPAKGGE